MRSSYTVTDFGSLNVGKPLVQVINDHLGVVHPGGLAVFFNAQARDFDLAALLKQYLAVLFVVLGITQGHRYVQAAQGAAGFDAERARVELVQGQVFCSLIYLCLGSSRALFFAGAGNEIASDDQLTQADAKRFDNHGKSLMGKLRRGAAYLKLVGEKKPAMNAGFFCACIT